VGVAVAVGGGFISACIGGEETERFMLQQLGAAA
jgi:hypothetical protein